MRLVTIAALVWCLSPGVVGQELVITLDGTKEYHRPGCARVAGRKDLLAMQRGQAEARGLKPHAECDPSYVPPPPKPVLVTIDAAGKYYHRDTCKRVGKDPRKVTLDEAAKAHWPCTVCKPPIRPRKKGDEKG